MFGIEENNPYMIDNEYEAANEGAFWDEDAGEWVYPEDED